MVKKKVDKKEEMACIKTSVIRDERFLFGFVAGLAIASMAGFLLLSSGAGNAPKKLTAPVPSAEAPTGEPEEKEIVLEEVKKDDWMRGAKKAPITIIEFSDVDCPFCKKFHTTMLEVMKEYEGKVNWVFRHAPLDQLHPDARGKAIAAECIGAQNGQDGFWKTLDRLMDANQSPLSLSGTREFALTLGVDGAQYDTCIADESVAAKVQNHFIQSTEAGMQGTPYGIIVADGQLIPIRGALPLPALKNLIDPLLNK